MAFFKNKTSFLEKVTMGAIGTQKVIDILNANGHDVIELERYSTSNKIWKTKIKRLRLPDLVCLKCGRRIESRAKSKLGIIMSDNEKNRERRWDSGMQEEDYVAFIACKKNDMGEVTASQTVNLFKVKDMRSEEKNTTLSKPKSISEGAERDRTWKSYTPGFDFTVKEIVKDSGASKIVFKNANGKEYSHSVSLKYIYVQPGESYLANEKIVASDIPCVECNCCSDSNYDFSNDLSSEESTKRYTAVKAFGYLPKENEIVESLRNIANDKSTDNRIRLEAYASLLRLQEDVWDEAERFMTELKEDNMKEDDTKEDGMKKDALKMEYVLILSELGKQFPQEVIKRLKNVIEMPETNEELKAAAIWGLPNSYKELQFCVPYCFHEDQTIRNHAVAKIEKNFVPELTDDIISNIGEHKLNNAICAHILSSADQVNGQAVINKFLQSNDNFIKQWLLFIIGISDKNCYSDLINQISAIVSNTIETLEMMWNCYATYTSQIDISDIDDLKKQKQEGFYHQR